MSCLHGVILEEASQGTVLSNEWWASILRTNLQKSLQAGDATNNALDALTKTSFGLLLLACTHFYSHPEVFTTGTKPNFLLNCATSIGNSEMGGNPEQMCK